MAREGCKSLQSVNLTPFSEMRQVTIGCAPTLFAKSEKRVGHALDDLFSLRPWRFLFLLQVLLLLRVFLLQLLGLLLVLLFYLLLPGIIRVLLH